jgi:hypothetical protein
MSLRKLVFVAAALVLCAAGPAAAGSALGSLDHMMTTLASESARSGALIRNVYRDHLSLLMLAGFTDIEGALDNGGLVPLPNEPERFNLRPRLDGPHPIGEKDLDNQTSYIAARPATIGMLLEIASRVKSGPLEITSLVRHGEYQESLRTTNANANTSVPMHTMGLAVDIALVNSPLKTVHETRDVLRRMQRNGDILFVGERRQLVFHVVPHPSRLGHFTDVYIRKVGLPPTSRSAHVVARAPALAPRRSQGVPQVTSEVLAVVPLAVRPRPAAAPEDVPAAAATMTQAAASAGRMLRRWLVLAAAMLMVGWRIAARPSARPRLFEVRL